MQAFVVNHCLQPQMVLVFSKQNNGEVSEQEVFQWHWELRPKSKFTLADWRPCRCVLPGHARF